MSVNEKMTAIADAIREKTGSTEALTLDDMALAVQKVFNSGKKAKYDEFWDVYQDNGNLTQYSMAFGTTRWNDSNFKPKYDIRPVGDSYGSQMFFDCRMTDLVAILEGQKVVLDTSLLTGAFNAFYCARTMTKIPELNLMGITAMQQSFGYCSELQRIEKIILNNEGTTTFNANVFVQCKNLEHVIFDGVIGQSGLDLKACTKLDKDSLMSVINTLKKYTDGSTHSITFGTTNLNKLTDAEKAIAIEKGWSLG